MTTHLTLDANHHSMSGIRDLAAVVGMTIISISWLVAGLGINLLQLLSFLLLRPVSRSAHRSAVYLLTYCMWSPLVALAEHGAGFRVRLWFANDDSRRLFGREHMIAIANHTFEVDWLFLWMAIDKIGVLASAKAMVKKVIRTFPIMGWAYLVNEFIFLERNWERDQDTLRRGMDNFLSFDRSVTVLMFCEGTRLTPAKFDAARQFALKKGVDPLKHHLMPRSRGFVCCIRHLKSIAANESKNDTKTSEQHQMRAIYNVQIACPAVSKEQAQPTFLSLLRGLPVRGDVFLQRIPIDSIPDGEEEEYLIQLYRRKDALMSYYESHDSQFPAPAVCEQPPPRLLPLLHLVLWCGGVSLLLAYLLFSSWTQGQSVLFSSLSGLLVMVFAGFAFLIRSTRAATGSTYGSGPAAT